MLGVRNRHGAGPRPGSRTNQRLSVFLSHTSDLRRVPADRSYVTAAEGAVTRAGHVVTDMAYFSAHDLPPEAYCRRAVAEADVYVGIIGHEYGSAVREHPGLSYTELEFEAATAAGRPRLIFLINGMDGVEPGSGSEVRQYRFRQRLRETSVMTTLVTSPTELELRLYQSLVELQLPLTGPPRVDGLWVRLLVGAALGAAIAAPVITRTPTAFSDLGGVLLSVAIGVTGVLFGMLASAGSGLLLELLRRWRGAIRALDDESSAHADRRAYLRTLVRGYWVKNELEGSLADLPRIELELAERPGAVDSPLRVAVRQLDRPDRRVPRGTPIGHVFHGLHDQVLILGEPGAGKTTTLLELARYLLDETDRLLAGPIPVVFHLSSWRRASGSLEDWLVGELQMRYDVPPSLGRRWVAADQVIPLLDGLDEVRPNERAACVEELNRFRVRHGQLPLAVCSRVQEYEDLELRLRLRGALVVQPLEGEDVDRYLERVGKPLAPLRAALREDRQLAELVTTPLFLSIMALTYRGQGVDDLPGAASSADRRRQILSDYVASVLEPPGVQAGPAYDHANIMRWLRWLAATMRANAQSVFYLDWMQPNWVTGTWRRRAITLGVPVVIAMIAGLVIGIHYALAGIDYALASRLVQDPNSTTALRVIVGVTSGLFGFGVSYWAARDPTITPRGRHRWSWAALGTGLPYWTASGAVAGIAYGVLFGLVIAPVYLVATGQESGGLSASILEGLILGPLVGIMYGLLMGVATGATLGMLSGLDIDLDSRPAAPGRDIRTSMHNGLVVGAVGGLLFAGVFALVFGLGDDVSEPMVRMLLTALRLGAFYWPHADLGDTVVALVVFGLVAGTRAGGGAYLRHRVLWHLLTLEGCMPRDPVRFLDHMSRLVLLRRRGGGYEFIHRMLLDYFADLDDPSPGARG